MALAELLRALDDCQMVFDLVGVRVLCRAHRLEECFSDGNFTRRVTECIAQGGRLGNRRAALDQKRGQLQLILLDEGLAKLEDRPRAMPTGPFNKPSFVSARFAPGW